MVPGGQLMAENDESWKRLKTAVKIQDYSASTKRLNGNLI